MNQYMERIYNGVIKENPSIILMLGMCPTLAVTTSATNGLGMGLSTLAVLIFSNLIISLMRKIIPDQVRLPAYIVIVASLVTIVDLLLQAYVPSLYKSLGIFIPLIVVNCIIIGRAESFAMKNSLAASALDGVFQGLGYTLVLVAMCVIRELLGQGTFGAGLLDISTGALKVTLDGTGGGIQIFPGEFAALSMILPFGGFITLGVLIALTQYCMRKVEEKKAKKGETK